MFNSTILDVLVGLVFDFLVVSLVASALTEALASLLKLRSSALLTGVKALLNDPDGVGIAKDLYNHALINPRDTGTGANTDAMQSTPAYIDPTQFANAMIELTGLLGKTQAEMTQAISNSQLSPQTKQLLSGMVGRAQTDVAALRSELASWFDSAMDRVSGAYKRMTQLIGFIAALVFAIALNIDTIGVAKALWVQPMLTKSIDGTQFKSADEALAKLDGLQLPIGWSVSPPAPGSASQAGATGILDRIGLSTVIGWLITAVASLFGAPFWYDVLQSFVRIKGAGPSPAEKKTGAGAAA
jgi:hypothetical protein